jgi:hypothetical protein
MTTKPMELSELTLLIASNKIIVQITDKEDGDGIEIKLDWDDNDPDLKRWDKMSNKKKCALFEEFLYQIVKPRVDEPGKLALSAKDIEL